MIRTGGPDVRLAGCVGADGEPGDRRLLYELTLRFVRSAVIAGVTDAQGILSSTRLTHSVLPVAGSAP